MASLRLNFLFHLFAFVVSGFAAFYEFFYIELANPAFPGKFRYLTFWNICFQTVYFGLCIVCDISGGRQSKSLIQAQRGSLQSWRDSFHACIAFPVTLFVVVSFWGLYAIDRELVFPKALDAIFPMWLNHLVHTTILPFIITEKFLCHHRYPKRAKGLFGVGFLGLLYISLVLCVAYFQDFWVYPILKVLSLPQRAAFISVCIAIFAGFYLFGELMTGFVWGAGPGSLGIGKRSKTKSFKGV